LELIKREIFTKEELDVLRIISKIFNEQNPKEIQLIGLKHINLKKLHLSYIVLNSKNSERNGSNLYLIKSKKEVLVDVDFVHLHNHTQFSVLQSTISVADLVKAAVKNKMPAVAMTDMGNMMGAFHFVRDVLYEPQ
jgi:DNA polymerase III subunit alpha